MAKNNRKPVPKSQREISEGLITTFDRDWETVIAIVTGKQ